MKKRTGINTWLIMSIFLLAIAPMAAAGIIYVDDSALSDGGGTSWADAFNYLQDALASASEGDEIYVAEGTYKPDCNSANPNGTGDRETTFQLISGVAIKGGYAGFGTPDPNARDIETYETILSGDLAGNDGPSFTNNSENSYHVVTIGEVASRSFLAGMIVTAGNANGPWELDHNRGSGLYSETDSDVKITFCKFLNNYASERGGAIYCNYSSSVTLFDCTFDGNSSGSGGGIYNEQGSLMITGCVFSENSARIRGGGAVYCGSMGYYDSGKDELINCKFTSNSATRSGGAVASGWGASPVLVNCIFNHNSALEGAGTSCGVVGSPIFTNCTFNCNRATGNGGGICIFDSSKGTVTLSNCVLWENEDRWGMDESAQIFLDDRSFSINYCCVQGWTGNLRGVSNTGQDPKLAADGYHLMPDSTCIDAGDPYYEPGVGKKDIDAEPRVFNNRIDIGADEFIPEAPYIRLSPEEFKFHAYQGGPNPESQFLYIQNIGPNTLKWEAVENCSWLEVVPISGESFRQLNEVALSVDVAGLDRGLYNCELTIMADGAVNSPKRVEVVLYVLAISLVPSQHETIQEAIDAAEDWTVVIVADGTYTGQGNRDIHFLGKAITVRSENGPDNCIIDCNGTENNPHRGFDFVNDEDTNSVLDGFSITNGYASGTWPDDCGGGIRCCDGHPTITNCIITGNIAAADGGGICCEYTDNLKISNCTISNNNAKYGGGICCYYSSPTITNCTVSNNYGKYGGGVYCGKNAPTISNCIISGNMYDGNFNGSQVHGGGGIFCYDSGMIVSNSIINGNSSNGFGGGILFDDGQQTIINSTITGNSAGSSTQAYLRPSGGGIAGCFGGHIEVLNCILWGNQAIGEPENEIFLWTITSVSTATVNYSNIEGGWLGEGNIRAVPFFVDPANGDYHLLPDSPCIDAGRNAGVYSDIEGNIRPYDFPEIDNNGELPEFDIGAYEAILPSIEIPLKFTPQALNLSSRGKFLKAHFVLPEGFSVDDVDVNTPAVIAPFAVESYKIKVMLDDEGLVRVVATFKRSDLCSSTTSYDDNIEVMVIGRLTTGQYFYGTEIIKVTDRAFEALDLLVSHWLECDCSRPDWCGGADLNSDSVVNLIDFALLNGCCFEVPEE